MYLTKHATERGPRWAMDGHFLPASLTLTMLLELPAAAMITALDAAVTEEVANGPRLAPVDASHEIWAAGVTYLQSREAREAESQTGDIYQRVYQAERPELFFKSTGARAVGPGGVIRVRPDSTWNTPEPEVVLVINRHQEMIGYTAGNDVSSRSIEGENPLYLPQAKTYDGSCALGPGIRILDRGWNPLPVALEIGRNNETIFSGATSTEQMKRAPKDLVAWLYRGLSFPQGAFLFTGTGLVPPEGFNLSVGDIVRIEVAGLTLVNKVE